MTKRIKGWRSVLRALGPVWLVACVCVVSGFAAFTAMAAPLPSQLGPEVPMTRPRDGFVGRLDVAPLNGPAGTAATVTAERLPPNQEFQLVWRTVKGSWKVDGPEYHG